MFAKKGHCSSNCIYRVSNYSLFLTWVLREDSRKVFSRFQKFCFYSFWKTNWGIYRPNSYSNLQIEIWYARFEYVIKQYFAVERTVSKHKLVIPYLVMPWIQCHKISLAMHHYFSFSTRWNNRIRTILNSYSYSLMK